MGRPIADRPTLLDLETRGESKALRRELRRMRWTRLGDLWIAFGLKLGHFVSPLMLGLIYFTLFLPFGLIGRISGHPAGWRKPAQTPKTELAGLRLPA